MTRIEASEDSFGRANTFYVLAWVITALVIATSFIDFRSYQRDVKVNTSLIELYSDLATDAAQVAKNLRSAIYLAPNYTDEKSGIESIRRVRSEVLARVSWLDEKYGEKAPDLTIDDRLVIQPALNFMKAMLLLNDALGDDHTNVEGEPSLLLAEHEAGSYLTADRIEELRIEDAARYLWLSSLRIDDWNHVLNKHIAALSADVQREDFVADFTLIIAESSSAKLRRDRKIASDLWTKWVRSSNEASTDGAGGKTEARRRASLTLMQTSEFLGQALVQKSELELLAGGESSKIEIPIVSIPLQLRDAIVVFPWILAFCSLAVLIYTRRAVRYSPERPDGINVVGNVPSFYAEYGLHTSTGVVFALLLLWLPSLLAAFLLPILQPVLISKLEALNVIFFCGVAFSLFLGLFTLAQVPNVLKLIDDGIAIKDVPD